MTLKVDKWRELFSLESREKRLGPVVAMIIVLYGLSLFLPGLGSVWVLTEHEVFAAQPAREMLRDGNWILPTFAGVPRLVKPPGTGWLLAGFMAIFQSDSAFVLRLPGVLSAIIAALAMGSLGARWWGQSIGLLSGLIQLTCYYIFKQARLAEADMPMCALITSSLVAFAWENVGAPTARRSRWPAIFFYLAMGASVLVKGLGPLWVMPPCILYLLLSREKSRWRFFANWIGLAIFAVMALGWPVAAWWRSPEVLHIWWRETIGRAQGEMGSAQPFYYYFWSIPLAMLPWTGMTLLGVVWLWRERGARIQSQAELTQDMSPKVFIFLTCWFGFGFVLLSVSAWKHLHYAMPILPALTIPTALGLRAYIHGARQNARARHGIAAMLWVAGCALAIVLVAHFVRQGAAEINGVISAIAIGGLGVLFTEHRRGPGMQVILLFLTIGAGATGAQLLVMPQFDGYRAGAQFGQAVSALVPAGEQIELIGMGEAQIVYYLRPPLHRDDTWSAATRFLRGPSFVLLHGAQVSKLSGLGSVQILSELRTAGKADDERLTLAYFTPRLR